MDSNVRVIRSFKKLKPIAEVPETPQYLTHFLPSPPDSLFLLSSSPNDQHVSPSDTIPVSSLGSSLGSPFNEHGFLGGSSSQPRLIQPPQSDEQKLSFKFERMETLLKDSEFGSFGEILRILFYDPSCVTGEPDPRGPCHAKAVSRVLQGRNNIKMADIIPLIYGHKHSAPSPSSLHYSERHAPFSSSVPPTEILYGRPCLFTWATNLVAAHVHCEIYELCAKDNSVIIEHRQMVAT